MDTIRRVRAARGATNLSLTEFAKAIGVGRQTLVRIEGGEREPKPHEYDAMARKSGLPVSFFYVEDLADALDGAREAPPLRERVAALEEAVSQLAAALPVPAPSDVLTRMPAETGSTSEVPGRPRSVPARDAQQGGRQ